MPKTLPPIEDIKATGKLPVRARAKVEYVAGGGQSWAGSDGLYRSLPLHVDDLTADFGADLYDRMSVDAQCAAALNLLKLAIIFQGVSLVNPFKQSAPEYSGAQQILEFCARNLDRLDAPLKQTLYELLDGLAYGYKIAEQVYEVPEDGPDKGRLCLRSLKVKPRKSLAFVVDAFMNVVALAAVQPGKAGPSVVGQGSFFGPDAANLLPREKFVVFSYRTRDSDPRGTSVFRAAYNAWWIKMQLWPEYLKYLSQFAGASLIGYLPEDTAIEMETDPDGNLVDENGVPLPTDGAPVERNPATAMLDTLLAFRNGTAGVFPYGSKVDPIHVMGEGNAFLAAFGLLDEQITKSILYQTLATSDSKHMARAASQVHQDVLDMVIGEGKTALSNTIRQDIIRPLVLYNYGPQSLHLMPSVSLPFTEHQDFAGDATAIAALQRAGYLHHSQLTHIDAKLDLPVRDEELDEVVEPPTSVQPTLPVEEEEDEVVADAD